MKTSVEPNETIPTIDVQALGNRCLGRLDFIQRTIGRFLSNIDGDLERFAEAQANNDLDGIASLAHRMKGTSLTVSALRIADVADQIEKSANQAQIADVNSQLAQLNQECSSFRVAATNPNLLSNLQ